MSKQIKFNKLPPTQLITIIGLNDYFGDGGPDVTEELTKDEFITKYKEEMECKKRDVFPLWVESSGDGQENMVAITIWNGSIHTIIP